ncbi:hypothetical protein ACIQMV_25640 [Streptomyces sp. NPDC091412]|uniref:hypothetical protein n=1 Tax=Streptomyces sp. NPDC091412 TaxID=3366002 RepID=UPI0038144741
MDQTPQRAEGPVAEASPSALPPPVLWGFLLLLALMFTASYAVGASVGPVAPGMHGTRTTQDGTGGHDGADMDRGDMGGTHMNHGSGG